MQEDDKPEILNYWENINLKIDRSLTEFDTSMLFIHNDLEFKDLIYMINKLPERMNVLYISLTKTYKSIKPFFNQIKMNMFCIDCVSSYLFQQENTEDCVFTTMPTSANDFGRILSLIPKGKKPNYIIIDSLSKFLSFGHIDNTHNITQFTTVLTEMVKKERIKLIMLYDQKTYVKLEDSLPLASFEKIILADSIKNSISWKGEK